MRKFKNKLLIFILLLLGYTFVNAEAIKILPIAIKNKQKNSLDNPTNILFNLKKAIAKNQKSHKLSKKEEAKEILEILKKSISTQAKTLPPKVKKHKKVAKKNIKKRIPLIKRKTKIKVAKKNIKKKFTKKYVEKRVKRVTLKAQQVSKKQKSYIESSTSSQLTKPIGFVKTLGIVGKSKIYEVDDLIIDKREELNNDGVTDIKTATTNELKELPFVKPIEVIKVSQPFEASEAKKYKLDKR